MGNKLIISAAGSGKTTYLINQALNTIDKKVLITTYTQANEIEIRNKFYKLNKCIPANVTIQTWFSFLIQHGVKPYQNYLYDQEINGLELVNRQSTQYVNENKIAKYYINPQNRIYSDKLSKFVIKCNEKSNGLVFHRIAMIYPNFYIDEVQDLAGYDLEIIKYLSQSILNLLLVGDPRQVTYLTHHERKYSQYTNGLIKEFIKNECKNLGVEIDENILNVSHRCTQSICDFADKIFPLYAKCFSGQLEMTGHDGVFLVREKDIESYINKFKPNILRYKKSSKTISPKYRWINFGESKGLTFDRVLLLPTIEISKWIIDNNTILAPETRAKFYVALTRAKFSVGIIFNFEDSINIEGVQKYYPV
ncbi:MAG: AAA family ATPase [bacterium]